MNGIQVDQMQEDFKDKLQMMMEQQAIIIGWTETNLEWNNYTVKQELYRQIKRYSPGSAWKTATSQILATRKYKLGGNVMILHKKSGPEH